MQTCHDSRMQTQTVTASAVGRGGVGMSLSGLFFSWRMLTDLTIIAKSKQVTTKSKKRSNPRMRYITPPYPIPCVYVGASEWTHSEKTQNPGNLHYGSK